jgi:hypothetical protein
MDDNLNDAIERRSHDAIVNESASILGSLARAGLNTTPFTGGIASLWSDWDSSRRFKRVEQCLEEMKVTIKRISPTPLSNINEAEFHLLEAVIDRVQVEHREQRRLEFGRLLASSMVHTDMPFDQRMRFVRALEEFDPIHMKVLSICRVQCLSNSAGIEFGDLSKAVYTRQATEEEMDGELLPALDLLVVRFGFLSRRPPDIGGFVSVRGFSPEKIAARCSYAIRLIGTKFLEFIGPHEISDPDFESENRI